MLKTGPGRVVTAACLLALAGLVNVANRGGAKAVAAVSISAPFAVDTSQLELARGESAAIEVAFVPTEVGQTPWSR